MLLQKQVQPKPGDINENRIRSFKSDESTDTNGYRQFISTTCSLINVVESEDWETGGPEASNTGSAAVPLSAGI